MQVPKLEQADAAINGLASAHQDSAAPAGPGVTAPAGLAETALTSPDTRASDLLDPIHDAPTGPLPTSVVLAEPVGVEPVGTPGLVEQPAPVGPAGPAVSSRSHRPRPGAPNRNRRRNSLVAAACAVLLIVGLSLVAWAPWSSNSGAQAAPSGAGKEAGGDGGTSTELDGSSEKSGGPGRSAGDVPAQGAGASGPAAQATEATGSAAGSGTGNGTASGAGGTGAGAGADSGAGSGVGAGSEAGTGSGTGSSSGTTSGTGTGSGSSGTSSGTTAARTTAPAAAKTNPYTAAQVCGSGYSQIDSHTLTSGSTTAKIILMYNGSSNCVVTLKSGAGVGTAQSMSASVQAQNGSSKVTDSGSFEYYAGPVRVSAKAICVKWGGSIGSVSWSSDWSHCG